jgi:hypothetical protein
MEHTGNGTAHLIITFSVTVDLFFEPLTEQVPVYICKGLLSKALTSYLWIVKCSKLWLWPRDLLKVDADIRSRAE